MNFISFHHHLPEYLGCPNKEDNPSVGTTSYANNRLEPKIKSSAGELRAFDFVPQRLQTHPNTNKYESITKKQESHLPNYQTAFNDQVSLARM